MSFTILPLGPIDLADLSCFLTSGFQAGSLAEFAARDVLKWKYLDPLPSGDDGPRSWIARDDETGTIVGHVGVVLTSFRIPRRVEPILALHMIDWLGSKAAPGVGTRLMMRAHQRAPVQYVLGGSPDARRTIARAGYQALPSVTVYRRVLRPLHRLRDRAYSLPRRLALVSRDLLSLRAGAQRPVVSVELTSIERFGPDVDLIIDRGPQSLILADRSAGTLNRLLNYPRGGIMAWVIEERGCPRGFALVRYRPHDSSPIRVAKLVDLYIDAENLVIDEGLIPASLDLLVHQLKKLGADVITACGSSPGLRAGLWCAGFKEAYKLDLHVRDRSQLMQLPSTLGRPAVLDPPPVVTFLDADYAYTP
jgi:hypothetical protein